MGAQTHVSTLNFICDFVFRAFLRHLGYLFPLYVVKNITSYAVVIN